MADPIVTQTPAEAAESPAEVIKDTVVAEGAEGETLEAKVAEVKPEEKKSNKRKFKIKVDGKESEEEIDFDNEEDLVKRIQLAKVAQQRMQEYSQLEKEVQDFVTQLKKNPKKVLTDPHFGLDLKKLAAEVIEEEIANSQKSPEQLEREKMENELKAMKEEREKEKEDFKKKEFERLQQQEFTRYESLMVKALEKSDLPKSPYVVKKMADYMLMGLNNNLDLNPEDVLPLVREEIQNDLKDMFSVMPEEVIEAIIGKDVFTRIRKKNVAKAKANPPQPLKSQVKETGQNSKEDNKADEKKIDYKTFFGGI